MVALLYAKYANPIGVKSSIRPYPVTTLTVAIAHCERSEQTRVW